MSNSDVDFFTDATVQDDPYPYFESIRAHGPVWRDPNTGMVVVTGYEEAHQVYRDNASFSACNAGGPLVENGVVSGFPVPEPLQAGDVSAQIEKYGHLLPLSDLFITFDPPKHTAHRGLTTRQLTANRIKEYEGMIVRLSDRQIDSFCDRGRCDFVNEYAKPFSLLTVAAALGVPEADHEFFLRKMTDYGQGEIREEREKASDSPAEFLGQWFTTYVEDHRRQPRGHAH